ncbi:hypothetical protein KL905_003951 [Ogataea polymorpha]|nr:hypothetical protein KL937_003951 [Ogataea polymorpha]KAG7907026.1 hypothetical protein KL906_004212 [Ogataea polymorpha]KAG7918940.1 hypothetical protein KL905_003951 [Ogataea polymorpha]KAG7933077.1 hypothetical protein KL904_004133 [Ogataea polymorpha]
MSGIWPFFNSSFSNATINKILAEIDLDQQQLTSKPPDLQSVDPPAAAPSNLTASRLLQTIQENDHLQQSMLESSNQSIERPHFNVSLFNKLIDQPNLLDEINLAKNQKLISYVTQPEVLETLIEYILVSISLSRDRSACDSGHSIFEGENNVDVESEEQPKELDKYERALQRSVTASEITLLLSSNIASILFGDSSLLEKLWSGFFDRDVEEFFHPCKAVHSDDDSETEQGPTGEGASLEDQPFKQTHNVTLFNNFLKLIDSLATANMNELMNFIRFQQKSALITDQFLKFVPESPTICDLLVRLISTDKPYNPNGLIDILMDQNLILNLLKLVKIYYLEHHVQDNLCNLLNGIVGISSNVGFWEDSTQQQLNEFGEPLDPEQASAARANNPNIGPNDLTRQLVSHKCVLEMLDVLINYGHYGLVTVVSVVIEVIRKNNSDYDEFDWMQSVEAVVFDEEEEDDGTKRMTRNLPNSRDPIYLGVMLKLFSIHLDEIKDNYLTEKYYKLNTVHGLQSSLGEIIEPLGYERFKVMELIAELLHCSNMILMNKSSKLDYLMYKRDLWRDVKKTESLVMDALNDAINHDITKPMEKMSLEDSSATVSGPSGEEFVKLPLDMSIGNFFKLRLLQTSCIPLIILKLHKFPWNNFMHNVVFDLVQQIFNGRLANWDEDRASNQEETRYDDNLSLNKVLIWSLFGDYEAFDLNEYECDEEYPGFFNLPNYILYCFSYSEEYERQHNFKLGYMGHLTLIAEEIHKFQNYVENFGMTREDQTFDVLKDDNDVTNPYYLKSSFYIFNSLFDKLFESTQFNGWIEFINTQLKEINAMYNKVLGNPAELSDSVIGEDEEDVSSTPMTSDRSVILLDNGDSEEFRNELEVIEGEEQDVDGGDLRPMTDEEGDRGRRK